MKIDDINWSLLLPSLPLLSSLSFLSNTRPLLDVSTSSHALLLTRSVSSNTPGGNIPVLYENFKAPNAADRNLIFC